jgi:dipeptidyl-peptidase III
VSILSLLNISEKTNIVIMADADQDVSQFIIPNDSTICLLECKKAFDALTNREKLYAHHLSRADWYGSLICLFQVCLLTTHWLVFLRQK